LWGSGWDEAMVMETKAYKGMGMEGGIARWYAKTTHKSLAEFQALAERLSAELPEGSSVLEVAPGPGYLAIELAKLGRCIVTGLDISETFVEIARKNAAGAGVHVDFRHGNASAMAFENESFDLVVCRAAFKNFSEPVKALAEMRRVLKSGGRAIVIDLRRDTPKEEIDAHVDNMHVGKLNSAFIKLTFRVMLLKRAYTRPEFEKFIAESGFKNHDIREANVGFEITLVK
jgi:ubiquinone/menaquinone biosynthesis C-methylase UbiE